MKPQKRNAEKTKLAITLAARRLFAQHDISAVSYRDIAAAAGVSHGLVQHYFGTREQMVAAIIHQEIQHVGKLISSAQPGRTGLTLKRIRSLLKAGETRFRDFSRLIIRAELAGVKPEKMLDPTTPTPAMAMADLIGALQANSPNSSPRMDPRLVAAYINASLFAFATMSPWLMKSVGLQPKDYQARLDEIADISVKLISLAAGTTRP